MKGKRSGIIRGLSQKKNDAKKSLIPDTLKSVGGIVPFFYMFFCAKHASRGVKKKKKKNM